MIPPKKAIYSVGGEAFSETKSGNFTEDTESQSGSLPVLKPVADAVSIGTMLGIPS